MTDEQIAALVQTLRGHTVTDTVAANLDATLRLLRAQAHQRWRAQLRVVLDDMGLARPSSAEVLRALDDAEDDDAPPRS